MKIKRKIVSLCLALCLCTVSVLNVSSCGKQNINTLTMGIWLELIAQSFGMTTYQESNPYFEQIDSNSPYFGVFQSAAEWEIVNKDDDLSADTVVTWETALVSLVNAGAFLDDTASNEDKFSYGINQFDPSIRKYWKNRQIPVENAVALLDKAAVAWAAKEYTDNIEKAEFAENVVDFTHEPLDYTVDGNTVTITEASLPQNLQVGDYYTLPATTTRTASIHKVASIEYIDGKAVIQNVEGLTDEEILEQIETLEIQETNDITFDRIIGIYDEDGNPIGMTAEEQAQASNTSFDWNNPLTASTLAYSPSQNNNQNMGFFNSIEGSLTFKLKDDWSVKLSAKPNTLSLELDKDFGKKKNYIAEYKNTGYIKASLKDVKLTNDVDYSWGKLHSATVKLDYTWALEGGLKCQKTGKIGSLPGENGKAKTSIGETISQYSTALKDCTGQVDDFTCTSELYICKIRVLNSGYAAIDFIIKGKVTATGELKLVVEFQGAQGIEYKNGNIRYISAKGHDADLVGGGKLEITIGPGFMIELLGFIDFVDVTIDLGVSFEPKMTYHLFDAEHHELYSSSATITMEDADAMSQGHMQLSAESLKEFAEQQGGSWANYNSHKGSSVESNSGICLQWELKPVIKLSVGTTTLIGKLLKSFNVNASLDIAKWLDLPSVKGHYDIGDGESLVSKIAALQSTGWAKAGDIGKTLLGIGAKCSLEYRPWDEAVDEIESELETDSTEDIQVADKIILSSSHIDVVEGETAFIEVTGLPDGLAPGNLTAKVEDESIATFEIKTGVITSKAAGITKLIVTGELDGTEYKAECAINVTAKDAVEFEGL